MTRLRSHLIIFVPSLIVVLLVFPQLGRASLWLDEAWVANAILRGTFDSVALRTTPLGFALAVAAVVQIAGPTEWAFRLVPFLFAVAALPVFFSAALVCTQSRRAAIVAVTLLATNLPLLIYARTFKPYTADIFFAALLVLLAERIAQRGTSRAWIAYAVAVGVAPLWSFPSVFVGAAAALALLTDAFRARTWPALKPWLITHAAVALAVVPFGVAFLLAYRSHTLLAMIGDTWSDGYPPTGVLEAVTWYGSQLHTLLAYLWPPLGLPMLWLIAVGLVAVVRQQPRQAVLFVAPLVLVTIAALAHAYPFEPLNGGRLLLFLLPGLVLLTAIGIQSHWLWRRIAGVGAMALVALPVLMGITIGGAPLATIRSTFTNEVGPLLADWEAASGDLVYVYYAAGDAFQFYAPEYRQPLFPPGERRVVHADGVTVVFGSDLDERPWEYAQALRTELLEWKPKRLWLVFSHVLLQQDLVLVQTAMDCGYLDDHVSTPGADLYLFRPVDSWCSGFPTASEIRRHSSSHAATSRPPSAQPAAPRSE